MASPSSPRLCHDRPPLVSRSETTPIPASPTTPATKRNTTDINNNSNTSSSRRGRPPLLAKSARGSPSINRFLSAGSTTAATMSEKESSVSTPSENLNPNLTASNSAPTSPPKSPPKSVDASYLSPQPASVSAKKSSRGRPRKSPVAKGENMSGEVQAAETPADATEIDRSAKKGTKRKRSVIPFPLDSETKETLLVQFQSEINSLINFFHEGEMLKVEACDSVNNAGRRAEIAAMMEESCLPYSRLVSELHNKLTLAENGQGSSSLTLATLRATVLSVGERISYGIPNPDADVLEDESDSCLWCWEVRDVKLFPESQRDLIVARRIKRKKISDRISALSAVLAVLREASDGDDNTSSIRKAEDGLLKTDSEESIRDVVSQWQQKKAAKFAAKDAKLKEKEMIKEQQRHAREMEKEQKRQKQEEERKRLQQEKERERLEKETKKASQKEAMRQEKEQKRQQEEAEKELKRKEKEAADIKKQAALQKQATLLGRFLQSKKEHVEPLPVQHDIETVMHDVCDGNDHDKLIHEMDNVIHQCSDMLTHDILSSHLASWRSSRSCLMQAIRRWGQRRFPKMPAVKELKLQAGKAAAISDDVATTQHTASGKRSRKEFEDDEPKLDKVEPELSDAATIDFPEFVVEEEASVSQKFTHFPNKRRKLLQFDHSHRPAYYGSYSKKSTVVRPRNPLKQEPSLDYENDSDEEWEEEDPGESLSDCDKDEEDDKVDGEEDEEAADGFVVPDGYLSESEGAHVDDSDSECDSENVASEPIVKEDNTPAVVDNEQSILKFARQRKALEQLTDQALRCNRPYIICNFHNKPLTVTLGKIDRVCLEVLKVSALSDVLVEVPCNPELLEKEAEAPKSSQKTKKSLPETALREMVDVLLSSNYGLKKLVGVLTIKFPTASSSQIKNKIREIADFVDNHWQVKKEILEQLGLPPVQQCQAVSNVPEPVSKSPAIQLKPITKFFSKRCLPPEKTDRFEETSPIKAKELIFERNPTPMETEL